MADTPPASSPAASTPESRAADQARIRKERREAKIRAGGSARLDKITGLGGGIKRDAPPQPSLSAADPTADPEEVDISQHFYTPARQSRAMPDFTAPNEQISDDQLRAMMLGNAMPQPGSQGPMGNPFAGFPGMEGMGGMGGGMGGPDGDDPMLKMLSQMMSGMGGPPGEGMDGMPSFPGMPQMGMPGQPGASGDPYAYIWRIVHAIFALGLGFYVAFTTSFSGTKMERDITALSSSMGTGNSNVKFFYIFATMEVLLQSTRFYLEKGQVQRTGILGMVMGFLPPPYKGYLELVLRYSRIWTTVSADAMVCLFVLGVICWYRGHI